MSANQATRPARPPERATPDASATRKFRAAASERLVRAVGATALYPAVSALIQLVSVPIFLRFWGATLYGEWLLLSTVPWYLSLSDMGFGSVAGNDMTMSVAAGDRDTAVRSFQSAWVMICAVSTAVAFGAAACVYLLPLRHWLKLTALAPGDFQGVLLLLIVYALGTLQTTLSASGFRCDGNYATSALLLNVFRVVEALGSAVIVMLGARPITVAAFLALARWTGQFVMWAILRFKSPWIRWGWARAEFSSIRRMVQPAVAFMAFPIGNALSLQGMLVVIGVVLGPIAVAVFSTTRTLTRVGFMILETVRHSIWPELSIAFGAEDWQYARKLHAKACQAALFLCSAAVVFLALFGRRIYLVWTHGSLTFEPALFYTLLVVVIADSLWYASAAASLACNAHQKIAAVFLVSTVACLVFSVLSMPRLGLVGPALALLAVELPMTRYVLQSSLAVLQESPRSFLRELCTMPDFRSFAAQLGQK